MALTATNKGGGTDYEPLATGTHAAICYAVIDLGTQRWEWNGEKKVAHKVLIIWEIPGERIEIERDGVKEDLPRVASKKYTLSTHPKANLSIDLIAWRGRPFTPTEAEAFDLHSIVGAPCLLGIVHKDKKAGGKRAEVSSISPLMKGMLTPVGSIRPILFSFETDKAIPEELPKWVKEEIQKSDEWKAMQSRLPPAGPPPFGTDEPVVHDPEDVFGDDEQIPF